MTGDQTNFERQTKRVLTGTMRVKSAALALIAILAGLIGCFVLYKLRALAADMDVALDTISMQLTARPWMIVVLSLPAIGAAVAGIFARGRVWVWITLTTILLLIPFGLVLYCFVQIVGSMYQYEQL